jgi:hypothetical protein
MGTQVQISFGMLVCKLPADNIYFVKARSGLDGSLGWLNENLLAVLQALPPAAL